MSIISKQNKNNLKKLISGLLIVGVIFAISATPKVLGQTADQLAAQKLDKQKQLDAILQKITDYQSQIKQKQSQANTLKNTLAILDLQIAEASAQIDATRAKIDASNIAIADVTDKIVKTENDITKQKAILKTLMVDINDLDQRSPLEIALENENFQQFLDQVQYVSSIQDQSQQALTKIKKLQADLQLRQADLKAEKASLDNLLVQLDTSKASLSGQRVARQKVLDETKGQEKAYQRLLTDSQQQENQLNKEIFDLDAAISAKLGNRKLPSIHGLLGWPMEGTLTQGYGNTGFTALGYNYHNGIDIAAPPGSPIYAAGDGVVVGTGTGTGAYGNWVAIKHTVGQFSGRAIVSLYGHMSSFTLNKGQSVKQGDLVGFEGNTGNTTRLIYGPHRGYHLHFTVFDAEGFGISPGAYPNIYGPYDVPYGATYNPLNFL
ncbi:MAG: peptidoglycan DD-metalloendopeptidase family protein [Candidatus Doudnabacteria bacterium]